MQENSVDEDIILVVDDSPDTVSMLSDALENVGFSALVALSGIQAISICKKIVPDLILLDAMMPDMDGFETCKKIKENHNLETVPVIFMTGLDSDRAVSSSFESGACDYIQKPIRISELIARIKTHIKRSREITMSRELLDTVGSSSLACDKEGNIKWTTPQAQKLLDSCNLKRVEILSLFTPFLRNTINSGDDEKSFTFESESLCVKLEGIKDNLYIFNLSEPKQDANQIAILCDKFELTNREGEVLYWVSQGKSNKDLAIILGISPRTVNKHLESVFEKMLVENRTSAANMAIKALNENR